MIVRTLGAIVTIIVVTIHALRTESLAQQNGPRAVDQIRAQAAGIRKLESKHLVLYTDLPAGQEVEALPMAFDRAVPQWAEYFGVDPAATTDWRVRAFLIGDRAKFDALGLMPVGQEFPNGYSVGSDVWLFEQPSEYYRRHLLLHEGTHAFMATFLGGCGPGWYMEGTAELMATHQQGARGRGLGAASEELVLNVMPRDRREVPMWGRIKLVRDAVTEGNPLSLAAVMEIDNRRQLGTDAYAWSWAAAKFLDSHPRYGERFRKLKHNAADPDFNDIVRREFADDWNELTAEWQAYIAEIDYGFDFDRMAIDFQCGTPLDGTSRIVTIAADRGWQSSGVWLDQNQPYRLTASGRYRVGTERTPDGVRDWPCEPGGITLEYHDGRPLGMLLGAIVDGPANGDATFAEPLAIGLGGTITPPRSGTLYLRVNDSPAHLGDNRGDLTIDISDR